MGKGTGSRALFLLPGVFFAACWWLKKARTDGIDGSCKRSKNDRKRELVVHLFGRKRCLGEFSTAVHTDLRSVIMDLKRELRGRGRPIRLGSERLGLVEDALASSVHGSIAGLRKLFVQLRSESEWTAEDNDNHYTRENSSGYHDHNMASQRVLSQKAMDLTGLGSSETRIVLDLGAGSGLSSLATLDTKWAAMVVGVDLSQGMLEEARVRMPGGKQCRIELIQADMGFPLPFRENCFDAVVSIGALHYLQARKDGPDRVKECFSEVKRVSTPGAPVSFQFFPNGGEQGAAAVAHIAKESGYSAALIADFPYRNSKQRWFLWCQAVQHTPSICQTPCPLFPKGGSCQLAFREWLNNQVEGHEPCLSADDVEWLQDRHYKQARALVRRLKHVEDGISKTTERDAVGKAAPSGERKKRRHRRRQPKAGPNASRGAWEGGAWAAIGKEIKSTGDCANANVHDDEVGKEGVGGCVDKDKTRGKQGNNNEFVSSRERQLAIVLRSRFEHCTSWQEIKAQCPWSEMQTLMHRI
jgi:ubiquinone/menaquinone biosynthesis C-methylase UbiE